MKLELEWLVGRYGVFRFEPDEVLPPWATQGSFTTVSRSERELSVLCAWPDAPGERLRIGPLRAARIIGVLDFVQTGIIAALSRPLAKQGISIFSVATFDTDYVLVNEPEVSAAVEALLADGFHFINSP